MSDRLLSQEEINALLHNNKLQEKPFPILSKEERDALGEIGNIAMGAAATTLSILINHKVKITTPKVSLTNKENLVQDFPLPHVSVEVEFTQGIEGRNLLILQQGDAGLISQAILGDTYNSEELLDDIKLSALSEAMNQMMGSAATSMSTILKSVVTLSPPVVEIIDFAQGDSQRVLTEVEANLVRVNFNLSIEGFLETEIMQLIPLSFAKEMVAKLLDNSVFSQDQALKEKKPRIEETVILDDQLSVHPIQFAPLCPRETKGERGNIDLLLDIPLDVSVELGRTERLIKEVLELGVGSLLELDKLAGEPVDIRVNGKLIAKGEVVVVGENFGVRVTEIIGVKERVQTLQ